MLSSLPKGKHSQKKQKQHVHKLLCNEQANVQTMVVGATPYPLPTGIYIPSDYGGLYTRVRYVKNTQPIFEIFYLTSVHPYATIIAGVLVRGIHPEGPHHCIRQ